MKGIMAKGIMAKMTKKINIKKIIVFYILIQPIIDVITSLLVRNVNEMLTLGIFVRTFFMIATAIYALFISNKKYRITMLIYYAILAIYLILFLVNCYANFGMTGMFTQIKGIVKTFYLPIIFIALIPIFKKNDIKIENKTIIYALFGYALVILLARVFGVAYNTYPDKKGTIGLFYAANEIGVIMSCTAPILVLSLINGEKGKIFNFITLALYIFSVLEMGTKAPFFGAIGLAVITLIVCVVKFFSTKTSSNIAKQSSSAEEKSMGSTKSISNAESENSQKQDKMKYLKKGLVTIGVIIISFIFVPYSPVGKNIKLTNGVTFPKIEFNFNKNNETSGESDTEEKEEEEEEKRQDSLISGRDDFLRDNLELYKNANVKSKIFGIGYMTEKWYIVQPLKLIEMDYFDIVICDGIAGFILYFIPFVVFAILVIKELIKKFKKAIVNQEVWFMIYSVFISFVAALLAGHVLTAPASGIFISVILIQLLFKLKDYDWM